MKIPIILLVLLHFYETCTEPKNPLSGIACKVIYHGTPTDQELTFLHIFPCKKMTIAIAVNMSLVRINLQRAEKISALFFAIRR